MKPGLRIFKVKKANYDIPYPSTLLNCHTKMSSEYRKQNYPLLNLQFVHLSLIQEAPGKVTVQGLVQP